MGVEHGFGRATGDECEDHFGEQFGGTAGGKVWGGEPGVEFADAGGGDGVDLAVGAFALFESDVVRELVEIYDQDDGVLHATIRRKVNGQLVVLYERKVKGKML